MRKRLVILIPLTIAIVYACAVPAQKHINALRTGAVTDELQYLPSERLLNNFTAGMSSVVADLLWIQCLQYTGRHYKTDRDFQWLNHMIRLVTRLDPNFVAAYRYGGIFLSMLKADDYAATRLFREGMIHNPDAWELPYEAAMTALINEPENPATPIRASHYLAMAVETGNAPEFVAETASAIQTRSDLGALERRMWEGTRRSGNPLMRELAARKLQELDVRDICQKLTVAIEIYQGKNKALPDKLEDLVTAGIIDRLPQDPFGGSFFIGADGKAQNTTLLDEQVKRRLHIIQTAVNVFYKKYDRWPTELSELETVQLLHPLPTHPYPWRKWRYHRATGDVS